MFYAMQEKLRGEKTLEDAYLAMPVGTYIIIILMLIIYLIHLLFLLGQQQRPYSQGREVCMYLLNTI
jgi:hypothetical protein